MLFFGQQDNFSLNFAVQDVIEGTGGTFERVGRGDVGFELALGEPGKELLDVFLVVPRLTTTLPAELR